MKVLVCAEFAVDGVTCSVQVWADQPGLLPPLPVDAGIQISGLMIAAVMSAWGWKFIRRFIAPKS